MSNMQLKVKMTLLLSGFKKNPGAVAVKNCN